MTTCSEIDARVAIEDILDNLAEDEAERVIEHLNNRPCAHEWVDARNSVVTDGEWCRKCHKIRPSSRRGD